LEYEEGYAFWARVSLYRLGNVALDQVIIHIPNGAYLGRDPRTRATVMAKLKRQGLRPGCFDYLVPVPTLKSGDYFPGLWLELKRTKGGMISEDQRLFGEIMGSLGWAVAVAQGAEGAWAAVTDYLANCPEKIALGRPH
jgi:hypothetical protein